MPLGNLTSQFFANIYLNELDQFVKHVLKAKYYIRYVDDFVILDENKSKLEEWKTKIKNFILNNLNLELHSDKSRIIPLSNGIDFVGFRIHYYFYLLRKRSIRKMNQKIRQFENDSISYSGITKIYQGWQAHAKWANTYLIRREAQKLIAKIKYKKLEQIKKTKNTPNHINFN